MPLAHCSHYVPSELGQQGMPMARRIAEAKIPIAVWSRRPEIGHVRRGPVAALARSRFAPNIGKDIPLLLDATGQRSAPVDLTRQLNSEGVTTT